MAGQITPDGKTCVRMGTYERSQFYQNPFKDGKIQTHLNTYSKTHQQAGAHSVCCCCVFVGNQLAGAYWEIWGGDDVDHIHKHMARIYFQCNPNATEPRPYFEHQVSQVVKQLVVVIDIPANSSSCVLASFHLPCCCCLLVNLR